MNQHVYATRSIESVVDIRQRVVVARETYERQAPLMTDQEARPLFDRYQESISSVLSSPPSSLADVAAMIEMIVDELKVNGADGDDREMLALARLPRTLCALAALRA